MTSQNWGKFMSHCWGTVILQTASYSTSVILTLHFFCFSYKSLKTKYPILAQIRHSFNAKEGWWVLKQRLWLNPSKIKYLCFSSGSAVELKKNHRVSLWKPLAIPLNLFQVFAPIPLPTGGLKAGFVTARVSSAWSPAELIWLSHQQGEEATSLISADNLECLWQRMLHSISA